MPIKKFNRTRPTAVAKKTFSVSQFADNQAGNKILIYGRTGMGKSTLASMAPNCVFIQPDNGLADLVNPLTGEAPDVVQGIDTFSDLRVALQTPELFNDYDTINVDTATYVQGMAEAHVIETIKPSSGRATGIESYGYGKGYKHVYDQMKLFQDDLDNLSRLGKNIVLLSQLAHVDKTDTTYGSYYFAQPELYDKKNAPICGLFVSWANFVFKLDYEQVEIEDKIGMTTGTRALFTQPEFSFEAKSRGRLLKDLPLVTFKEETDDSIWSLLFPKEEATDDG